MSSEESGSKNVLSNLLISYGEEESLKNFLSFIFKKKTDVFDESTKNIGSGFSKNHHLIKYRKDDYFSFTFVKRSNKDSSDERSEEEKEEDLSKRYNLYLYLKMFCNVDEFNVEKLKEVTTSKEFQIDTALILLFVENHEEEEEYGNFEEENLLIVNLEKKKITKRKLLKNFLKFIAMKEQEKENEITEQEDEKEKEKTVEPSAETKSTKISEDEEGPSLTPNGTLENMIDERNQDNEDMIKKLQQELEELKQENDDLAEKAERHEDESFSLKRKLKKLKKKKVEYKCDSLKFENEFDSLRKQKFEDDKIFQKIESEKIILENLRKAEEMKFKKELEGLRLHLKEKDVVVEELSQQKNELLVKLEDNNNNKKKKRTGDESSSKSTKNKGGAKKKTRVSSTKKKIGGLGKKRMSLPPNSAASALFRKSRTLKASGDNKSSGLSSFSIKKQSSYRKRYANRRLYEPGDRLGRTAPNKRSRVSDILSDDKNSESNSSSSGGGGDRQIVSPRTASSQQKMKFLKNRKKQKSLQSLKIDNEKLGRRIKDIQKELAIKEKSITLLKLQLKNEKRMKKNDEIQIKKLKNLLLKKNETIAYLRLKISKL